MGYFIETDRATGKVVREGDTAMCAHCQFTMEVPPAKQGQVIVKVAQPCGGCKKFICSECQKKGGCRSFMRAIDAAEQRGRMLEKLGLSE